MSNITYGVLIARCQVHELHEGHLALFREVIARHPRVILFLGVKPIGATFKNPLDFETRKAMIRATFPEITVEPLLDRVSDSVWSNTIDERLDQLTGEAGAILYGSRDSFIPHYFGKYEIVELDLPTTSEPTYSGTYIREKLTHTVMGSADFRAGCIYAITNLRAQCKATVDTIITYHPDPHINLPRFLLARKPGEVLWRFIGGFSEPTTPSYEFDAEREAMEETGLKVNGVKYIGSTLVDDWRWRGEPDQIKTLVFVATVDEMGGQANDDIVDTKWFHPREMHEGLFIHEHKPLFEIVKNYFNSVNPKTFYKEETQ